jgi:hypothetical protein
MKVQHTAQTHINIHVHICIELQSFTKGLKTELN